MVKSNLRRNRECPSPSPASTALSAFDEAFSTTNSNPHFSNGPVHPFAKKISKAKQLWKRWWEWVVTEEVGIQYPKKWIFKSCQLVLLHIANLIMRLWVKIWVRFWVRWVSHYEICDVQQKGVVALLSWFRMEVIKAPPRPFVFIWGLSGSRCVSLQIANLMMRFLTFKRETPISNRLNEGKGGMESRKTKLLSAIRTIVSFRMLRPIL